MKLVFFALFTFSFLITVTAQKTNPAYDKVLADSLGGDDYGMKTYMLVILKTGSYNPEEKRISDSLFKGHMENIGRLAKENKLIVAGPLGKNDMNYRGIFILSAKTIEEARSMLETDPAIHAHVFDCEIYKWYGSAALPTYLPFHERISKKKM